MRVGRLFLPSLLACTVLGILGRDAGALPANIPTPVAVGGAALLAVGAALRRPLPALAGLAVLAVTLGAWRGGDTALPVGPGSASALVGEERRWLSGRVVEDPRPRGERQEVVLDELRVGATEGELHATTGRLLVWLPRARLVAAGDRVTFTGRVDEPQDFDGFAYRDYLARQGIGAVSSAFDVQVEDRPGGDVVSPLSALRTTLLAGLNSALPEPEAALGAGILLGVRSGMAPAIDDAFATAGLTHVVAISGWNIAIVVALVTALSRPLTRLPAGRAAAIGVAAAAVAGYVLLTGATPSVVRAALMAAALVLARLGGARAHAAAALMVAALAMLVASPPVLWDVGFQLSALATAGLIWFAPGLEAALGRWPSLVREPVALTLAAQVTTLPVILLNFERVSLVAPLANVVVVPLVPVVMMCSALASGAGALTAGLTTPGPLDVLVWAAGGAAWLFLRLMILAGQLAAAMPLAAVDLSAPGWLAAAWYPMLPVLQRRMRTPATANQLPMPGLRLAARAMVVVPATLLAVGTLTFASGPDGRLHLLMLDVGQGDAILIRSPSGATALVDGGPDPDLAARRLGEVLPFWQRTLDVLILTHPHEDHVAGLVPALERYRVRMIMEPGRAYENPTYPRFRKLAAAEPGAQVRLARAGERIELDEQTSLTVLFPGDEDAAAPLPEGDINNASVVVLLEYGAFRALLTGDAEAPVEQLLLSRGRLGPVDVLKVGHHGSDSSTVPALLEVTRPRYALISAGTDNEYGHPHGVTLGHLSAVPGITVLRTDRDGTVELVVDGSGIGVHRQGADDPGSIGPWPSPPAIARRSCWRRTPSRRESSGIRAGWRAWRRRRRASWSPLACRSTASSSRSPPCCTTSTNRRRAARSSMA